ncbi:Tim44/TimA family putative adaptor protein [Hyphomonas jannaschiana]|uniref:Tim44 domain-containing protein n=1 Tax=Hyphomonas jannaschiana VP2 TaxID=1280952 RepID=A0A059FDF6_9PROT|nr:Tim44/TimA family putative adaptor protein [Hyphomonas jannaschiana]KCZ88566.1 Tim44 domain-containing protein [Hyphomonas jannaschiana VP2]MCA8890234.1 Tim44 domain-containing protein [Hyphomonas sp.]
MDPVMEVMILAAVALFVLSRLYFALGKGDNDNPVSRPTPATAGDDATNKAKPRDEAMAHADKPIFTGPAAGGLEEIYNADRSFSTPDFMRGARAAYEIIVSAFARGDRDKLRPMLDDDVYEAWDAAIAAREPDQPAFELLRIRKAEIESADLDGDIARVAVRYEAELGDGEMVRTAKEIWTFMRNVRADDPNWILDDVEVAN